MTNPKTDQENKDCFVIMPISDPEGYDPGHFKSVYEDIFKVAIKSAGYVPIRADDVTQTNLIHLDILQRLVESPMAICDLSSRNPNVLFELGLRQAFDMPTVLVQECNNPKIFDIAPLRITDYRKELRYREVVEDQESISKVILATKKTVDQGDGVNSLVKLLSLVKPAKLLETSGSDSMMMMNIVLSELSNLRNEFARVKDREDSFSENSKPKYSIARQQLVDLIEMVKKNEDEHVIVRKAIRLRTMLHSLINSEDSEIIIDLCKTDLDEVDLLLKGYNVYRNKHRNN